MMKPILLSLAVLIATDVVAQTSVQVPVEAKATAREQLEAVLPLIRGIERAKTPADRQLAMLTAASSLEVIPRKWPHDRDAIVRAGLLEADVFARNRAARNALEVLSRIEPAATRPPQRLEIAGRRGALLAKLGQVDEAATVFATALAMHVDAPRDRLPILTDAAAFYFFQHRNAELSRVLRESASLDRNELAAMTLISRSLEANVRDHNFTEARKDYADLANRYSRAQRLPVATFGSGDAAALRSIAAALDRWRGQLGSP
jgi:tetratricopeptide (TPR) repeat protein